MSRFLISFDDGWMQFPDEDLQDVSDASHAVVREAKAAGVWFYGAGLMPYSTAAVVAQDGAVTDGPPAGKRDHLTGFCILDVETREDALEWAGRFAAACRCPQEVREIPFDPES